MYKLTEVLNVPNDDETLENCFFIIFLKSLKDYILYDYVEAPECTNEIY